MICVTWTGCTRRDISCGTVVLTEDDGSTLSSRRRGSEL